jgi:hypothetical protein
MTERAKLTIKQIVVEAGEGNYCAVVLPQDRMDFLIGFIETLSEGPIKLVRMPGVRMVPISDLETLP